MRDKLVSLGVDDVRLIPDSAVAYVQHCIEFCDISLVWLWHLSYTAGIR